MSLSDTAIRNAKPRDKRYKIYDSGGLFMIITPSGGKWWRFRYYFEGKEKLLALGVYPYIGLKDARERREEARTLVAKGIDPGLHKKAVRQSIRAENENSYEVIAREWVERYSSGWAAGTRRRVLAAQGRYIFPLIGKRPIRQITAPELLVALRHIEKNGKLFTAHRILQDCGRIFRYAIATGRGERDTAADLRGALPPAKGGNFATITDPASIGILIKNIDEYTGDITIKAALKMIAYTFVRSGELRRAEWSEFNAEAAEWRIPEGRMKMRQVHIVPLARQVVELLKELHLFTGHSRYVFPALRSNHDVIGDTTMISALRRIGYSKSEMSIHGFRSMASTRLNEMGFNRDWIERQLSHGDRGSIRGRYNFAEYLPERRKMMQAWADYLDMLRG